MCGIIGFLDKTGNATAAVGQTLLNMLTALGCRGPDSAGVAMFGGGDDGFVLRVKLGERGHFAATANAVLKRVEAIATVREHAVTAAYLRLVVNNAADVPQLIAAIEDSPRVSHPSPDSVEVVSLGRKLEIVKQVGSPQNLEATYGISRFVGTHGIGHTRLSTESRVDLSHSQPFWAHGAPDLAIVHNGHITNYHKMRRQYEQRGVRFYTENDSEIVGIFLAERLSQGMTLVEALTASQMDFDGSFSYLAATADALAFCKDPFALKPLIVAETDAWVAVATEEIALRLALGSDFETREPEAREVKVWSMVNG
jgi:glutamate synthase domain-containing protein 1